MRIRRIWENTNSTKDQIAVQFFDTISSGEINPLLALTQDINLTSKVTALLSFSKVQAMKYFGTTSFDASDLDNPDTYMELPKDLAQLKIQIVENTIQNPATPNQSPKVNPKTGKVLMHNGKPIYRHTTVVYGEAKNEFLKHDVVAQNAAATSEGVAKQSVI